MQFNKNHHLESSLFLCWSRVCLIDGTYPASFKLDGSHRFTHTGWVQGCDGRLLCRVCHILVPHPVLWIQQSEHKIFQNHIHRITKVRISQMSVTLPRRQSSTSQMSTTSQPRGLNTQKYVSNFFDEVNVNYLYTQVRQERAVLWKCHVIALN